MHDAVYLTQVLEDAERDLKRALETGKWGWVQEVTDEIHDALKDEDEFEGDEPKPDDFEDCGDLWEHREAQKRGEAG